jgi:hypothetical protein
MSNSRRFAAGGGVLFRGTEEYTRIRNSGARGEDCQSGREVEAAGGYRNRRAGQRKERGCLYKRATRPHYQVVGRDATMQRLWRVVVVVLVMQLVGMARGDARSRLWVVVKVAGDG